MKKKLKKIIIGNMKMNGSKKFNESYFSTLKEMMGSIEKVNVALCLPYPYLFQAQKILSGSNIFWGAQNVAKYIHGPFTGEVSVSMLQDFGVGFVIVGHSERSTAYCESDENIAIKFNVVKEAKMTPVLCVGETLIEREAGIMESVVKNQIYKIIKLFGATSFENSIIAYEPIWAIGSELSASPERIEKMCNFIKDLISHNLDTELKNFKVIYGGSVNPKNALQLCEIESIDGVLVGRASLIEDDFFKICEEVEKIS